MPDSTAETGGDVTTRLEQIRLRIARRAVSPGTEAEGEAISDSMLLLAAVDAALERHRGEPSIHDYPPKPQLYCTSCGVDDGWYNVPWPCETVQAITAELTGTGSDDGG